VSADVVKSHIVHQKKFPMQQPFRANMYLVCALFVLLSGSVLHAQPTKNKKFQGGVYLELNHWIYDFLQRQFVKGNLSQIYSDARPIARGELARYVRELALNRDELNRVEREQLNFCLIEFKEDLQRQGDTLTPSAGYQTEIDRLKEPVKSSLPKWLFPNGRNLLHDEIEDFSINIDLIGGLSTRRGFLDSAAATRETQFTNGFMLWGYLGEHLDFYFNLRDNTRSSNFAYPQGEVTTFPRLGFFQSRRFGSANHDEATGYIKFNSSYFEAAFGKFQNQWGQGATGSLVLSDWATSYNQLLLRLKIWKLKYTIVIAELIHFDRAANRASNDLKMFYGHRVDLQPFRTVNIGFFESIISANRGVKVGYLVPPIFYRSVEHYYASADNAALGMDINWRVLPSLQLYGQLFIDDLTTSKIGTGWWGNKIATQAGVYAVDAFNIQNIDARVEYTRLQPYTYSPSSFQAQESTTNYTHYDSPLGYFLPPNSDNLFVELRYRFSKQCILSASVSVQRYGTNIIDGDSLAVNVGGDINQSLRLGKDSETVFFLEGNVQRLTQFRTRISYELIRNLFAELEFRTERGGNYFIQSRNGRGDFLGNAVFARLGWNL
jgi:hypothetical protein